MKKSRIIAVGATAIILVGATAASAVTLRFTDVPQDHTFAEAIDWMDEHRLTYGRNPPDNDRFCPEDYVTRGQMSAFMMRLAESDLMQAGSPGHQGPSGANGQDGAQGETGDKGDQGIQGEKGDKGDQGIQGEKGDKGDQGIQGEKGDKGDQGIQGEKGDKGDQGPAGPGASFTRVAGAVSAGDGTDTKTATATCPTGVAVGGGVLFAGDSLENLSTTANYPSDETTWTVSGAESSPYPGNGKWSIQAFVICAG